MRDVNAIEVGRWIRDNLPFDRLYLYGVTNALHVSHGPEQSGRVYAMLPVAGRRIPRDVTRATWEDIARMLDGG